MHKLLHLKKGDVFIARTEEITGFLILLHWASVYTLLIPTFHSDGGFRYVLFPTLPSTRHPSLILHPRKSRGSGLLRAFSLQTLCSRCEQSGFSFFSCGCLRLWAFFVGVLCGGGAVR